MAIDGFSRAHAAAFQGFSARGAERFYRVVSRLSDALHVQVEGLERIPKGRALIVANHAFGFDVAFAMAAVHRATGRVVWSLGEHAWWSFPFLRRAATAVGVVDGTQVNADRLLSAGELVLVLPGGLREAMKPRELRYRLLWGHRYGFVRTALRNCAPIVPLACVGGDEVFDLIGNAFDRGRRWLGRAIPIPRPAYGLPIVHRVPLRYVFGDPISPDAPPERAGDPAVLRRIRLEVEGALQELIDIELARRAGFPVEGDRAPRAPGVAMDAGPRG